MQSMTQAAGGMISGIPGINSSKLDSVMESLQRQRIMEQQAQLHHAMQALQNNQTQNRLSPTPSNNSNEQRSRNSGSENENEKEGEEDVEEIKGGLENNGLPVPNLNLPGFPPGFAQSLQHNMPNFDPSHLPQGVRELAMLQHQQLAQRSVAIAAEAQKRLHLQQNNFNNSFKGPDSSGIGGSPTTPNPSTPNSANGGGVGGSNSSGNQQDWTFEEQFKQLYEIDDESGRKDFLDELFTYMQKRGTPVSRIPIMAKQVLDLYRLYKLVVERGGLVEVINKKIWREITKGLNLPSSITSAAFTLRTQYMKYLYPYECEKEKLSSPAELQAAIDGNRREGRRPSYGNPYGFPEGGGMHGMHPAFINMPGGAMAQMRGLQNGGIGGHIRPEERLMAAQQQQLVQAANAQHMAAMVALEAMQHQAKQVAKNQTQANIGRQSPIKRERENDEHDSLPNKIMRNMPGMNFPGFNNLPGLNRSTASPPVSQIDPNKNFASSPLSILQHAKEHGQRRLPLAENYDQPEVEKPVVPANVSPVNSNSALARLFPSMSTSMGAKLDINTPDPDDDSDCGSINMCIQVNGIMYEGVLFAKLQEEGYLEAKKCKSPSPQKASFSPPTPKSPQ